MTSPRLLTCGHWIVDQGKRIDHWPEQQTLALIDKVVPTNGGGAFNVACDLRRLDPAFQVDGIGRIGTDSAADFITTTCRQSGIGTEHLLRTPDVPTSFTDVMTEKNGGRRTFFHAPGANTRLVEADVRWNALLPADVFYLGYLGMLPGLDALDGNQKNGSSRLLSAAQNHGLKTAADLVSAPNERLREEILPCLPFLDILFTNEIEAARVLAQPSDTDPSSLARDLSRLGTRGLVVLHLASGAVCAAAGKIIATQGCVRFPDSDIVGTSGAGDAFAAGFLTGVLHDRPVAESLKLAVCSAATSLRDLTCSDSVVHWKDCLTLGSHYGFRPPPHS